MGSDIVICSNGQAVIIAWKITSRLVLKFQFWLVSFHFRKQVRLVWDLGHVGIKENETADKLARSGWWGGGGAVKPELIISISRSYKKNSK